MPYTVLAPERKEFTLDKADARRGVPQDDPTRITIKQATLRENANRSQLFAEFIREEQSNGRVREILHLPLYDLLCREVFLTLVDCNIIGRNGKPLFTFKKNGNGEQYLDMTLQQFQGLWGMLEEDIALEIHEKVLEVNPNWKFSNEVPDLGEG